MLDINEPASKYITEWQGTPSESVTIRDLLANASGRFWSLNSDYNELIRAPDKTAYAIGLAQQAPPETTWNYNNSAIQTLDAVIKRATRYGHGRVRAHAAVRADRYDGDDES